MSAPTGMRPTDVLRDAAGLVLLRTSNTPAEASGEFVSAWLKRQAALGPDECSDLSIALANVIVLESA